MKIKTKFIITNLIIILTLIILVVFVLLLIKNKIDLDKSYNIRYKSFIIADELQQSSNDLTRYCRTYVSTGDNIWKKKYWRTLDIRNGKKPRPDGRTISLKDSMKRLGFTKNEFDKLKTSEKNSNDLVWTETIAFNAMNGLFDDGTGNFTIKKTPDIEFARRIMFDEKYHADKLTIMKPIDEFFILLNKRTENDVLNNNKRSKLLLAIIAVLIFIIICIVIFSSFFISKTILKPIERVVNAMKKIANKEIDFQITENRKDEIGELNNSINKIIANLKTIISSIYDMSTTILLASGQLNTASQRISERANEQASTTEEIASSIEQMKETVNSNNKKAENTGRISSKAADETENSNKILQQTIKSVSEINEKITIISEIAGKTDILSINAAIEAANAGEKGKGFAVVANEIRKLADKTKNASKEINILSEKGQAISKIAEKNLTKLIPEIIKSAELVNDIISSGKEQQTGIEAINISIQQLNEITNENSASAEEMSASTEKLLEQSEELKKMISIFKIGDLENKQVNKK